MYNSIPICRSVRNHWIYKPDYFIVWFEMLATAKYTDGTKKDVLNGVFYTLEKGQFIFGYPSWSQRLGVGQQKLRTLIKRMINDEMIVLIKKYPKFTIYEIRNYSKYNNLNSNLITIENQGIKGNSNKQTNNQLTSSQQATNNIQESKESNKKDILYTPDFEEFYSLYPNPWNKVQTFKNWNSLIKKGECKENIILATKDYIRYIKVNNIERKYIVRSTNFIGQHQEYKGYLNETKPIKEKCPKIRVIEGGYLE